MNAIVIPRKTSIDKTRRAPAIVICAFVSFSVPIPHTESNPFPMLPARPQSEISPPLRRGRKCSSIKEDRQPGPHDLMGPKQDPRLDSRPNSPSELVRVQARALLSLAMRLDAPDLAMGRAFTQAVDLLIAAADARSRA